MPLYRARGPTPTPSSHPQIRSANNRPLVLRGSRLPPDRRCVERANRSREPPHREDPSHRPRLPQLQQLQATATPRLRHSMGYRPNTQNPRLPTSVRCVEPHHLTLRRGAPVHGARRPKRPASIAEGAADFLHRSCTGFSGTARHRHHRADSTDVRTASELGKRTPQDRPDGSWAT